MRYIFGFHGHYPVPKYGYKVFHSVVQLVTSRRCLRFIYEVFSTSSSGLVNSRQIFMNIETVAAFHVYLHYIGKGSLGFLLEYLFHCNANDSKGPM